MYDCCDLCFVCQHILKKFHKYYDIFKDMYPVHCLLESKLGEFYLYPMTGPVFVEFPIDVLYPYSTVKKEIGMKDGGPTSLGQKVINW